MHPLTPAPQSPSAINRQKCLEDFDIQVAHARRSMERGYFATARAELRGAELAIDMLEGGAPPPPAASDAPTASFVAFQMQQQTDAICERVDATVSAIRALRATFAA